MKKVVAGLMAGSILAVSSVLWAESTIDQRLVDKRGEISAPNAQGLYTKPVWRKAGKGTYLGGYMDFEYRSKQDGKQKFESIRLVPFIYADLAPGLRFATEIEFEHGGATSGSSKGDSKVEFAVLDYDLLGEYLTARGGVILIPLGKFNSIHDSPINDLNDRPMVSRSVIPSTFFEPGAGLYGSAYLDPAKVDYQLYFTQGFNGGVDGNDKIRSSDGLRGARSAVNGDGDNNENIAISGRVGVSPFLGSEVGFSFHTGTWDNAGQNALTILALDFGFQWRNFEFLGEYANAGIDRNAATHASVPGRMEGYYLQTNVHFLQDVVRAGSVFTGVVRLDDQDLDLDDKTSNQVNNATQRLTFGLNFRPIEQTVIKLDYQINYENWYVPGKNNNAWVLGFATYF